MRPCLSRGRQRGDLPGLQNQLRGARLCEEMEHHAQAAEACNIKNFAKPGNQDLIFSLKKRSNQANTVNCISALVLVLVCFEY